MEGQSAEEDHRQEDGVPVHIEEDARVDGSLPKLPAKSSSTSSSSNPFAKARIPSTSFPSAYGTINPSIPPSSFSRTSLLPTPRRRIPLNLATPVDSLDQISQTTPLIHRTRDVVNYTGLNGDGPLTPPIVGVEIGGYGSMGRSGGSVARAGMGTSKMWRMLWKGGVEVRKRNLRLDGICFVAKLNFPSAVPTTPSLGISTSTSFQSDYFGNTPSNSITNLASHPHTHALFGTPAKLTSPFPNASAGTDADLCLALESMRGRKTLVVKGIVRLDEVAMLEGGENDNDASGVQVHINPNAKPLWRYVTNALCRDPQLSKTGKTRRAIVIQLGDEGINSTANSIILIYGQAQEDGSNASKGGEPSRPLLLMAAKRKAPPPAVRAGPRPGEPLPRAPVFPTHLGKKPPPPIFHRSSSTAPMSAGTFLRQMSTTNTRDDAPSSSSTLQPARKSAKIATATDDPRKASRAGIAPQAKKVTPGRRGEKRKKPANEDGGEDVEEVAAAALVAEERRRGKIGKMTLPTASSRQMNGVSQVNDSEAEIGQAGPSEPKPQSGKPFHQDEDIFGNGGIPNEQGPRIGNGNAIGGGSASRRSRITPTESKNKATIKKRLLSAMESRGMMSRQDEAFKEIFAMANKGTCFALRNSIASDVLEVEAIDRIVSIHLEMYWPTADADQRVTEPEIIVIDDAETPLASAPSSDGVEMMEMTMDDDGDEPG